MTNRGLSYSRIDCCGLTAHITLFGDRILSLILICLDIFFLAGYIGLAYFLLRGLNSLARGEEGHANPQTRKKVSVVVALRNEEKNLPGLMQALINQDYEALEIILVDDNSSDDTRRTAEKLCENTGIKCKIISAGENIHGWGPKKNALHGGIEAAEGEIIAVTDADCRPGGEWISGLVEYFEGGAGAVVGFSPLKYGGGICGRLKALEALATGIIAAAFIGAGKPFIATGRNFAYLRSIYKEIGGFGEAGNSPAGDDDLLLQAIAGKAPVAFAFEQRTIIPSFPEAGGYISRKRRHFHSTRQYRTGFKMLGMLVYGFIACISVSIIGGISAGNMALFLSGLLALQLKMMADLNLLERGARLFKEPYRIMDVLVAELLQIPYTLILQPLSLIGGFEWRGRKL